MKTKKVLIINQCSGNKGDRSVLYNLLNLFDKHDNIEITVSTSNVSDWKDIFTDKIIKFVPWGWFINPNADSSKRLKFLMIRIFRKTQQFKEYISSFNISVGMIRMLNVLGLQFFMVHLMACFWFLAASLEEN